MKRIKLLLLLGVVYVLSTNANNKVRSEFSPVLKKSVYPDACFCESQDKLSAVEVATTNQGDLIKITHSGIETYTLNFRFETSRFTRDINDIKFWAFKSLQMLKEIQETIDTPVDYQRGLETFENYIQHTKKISLNNEVDYGINEVRYIVNFHKVEKIAKNRYAVEIKFIVGPL